ncbi:aldo/keto reductase [Spiractinospora alimapuensis]|uniref:aldo/keto reductase n=1 Tax=Spiractinospora alimapuensis TaxID=2820884 RepID=UPI001F36D47A|nr:aldo/keto reductase [Spiractinospora alimapuensis]QVQ53709.1 aldo/keto reductase [Spiractinospora alimapuensis]
MRRRELGGQGMTVTELGLGCMGMTHSYAGQDEAESLRTLQRAVELGVDFFDTADMYGPWTNERLVGAALRPHRDDVVLATKFGQEVDPEGRPTGRVNGRPEYVRAAVDGSLHRLGVDHIDLYYQHRVDPDVPVEETWGAMAELVTSGKVGFLGISEAAPETVRRAHATHPVTALQYEYSLFTRDIESDGILSLARELGIGVVAYSPLGRGILTGAIQAEDDLTSGDARPNFPRFAGDNLTANVALVRRLEELAASKGATPGQLAIAWVLAQGEDVVTIPGTKRQRYLEENLAARELALTPADLAAIDEVAPPGAAHGDRYPPTGMRRVRV